MVPQVNWWAVDNSMAVESTRIQVDQRMNCLLESRPFSSPFILGHVPNSLSIIFDLRMLSAKLASILYVTVER